MALLCISPGCRAARQHQPSCTGQDCRGCLPALAEIGCLCQHCLTNTTSVLAEIAELYTRLPAHLMRAGTVQPRVSGTPATGAPFNVDVWDLLAPARPDGGYVYDPNHDQTGAVPVAELLHSWARWWAETRNQRETPPDTVPSLVTWLRNRLEWAAEHHPAVADFIGEIRRLRGRLAAAVGEVDPPPERCHGVPCRRCDLLSLYRRPDGSGEVDCHNPDCQAIYHPDEYRQWVALNAAAARREFVVPA